MVEEIAVVCYGDYRAGILLQVLFEPVDALGVEVVGRLVEQQHVGLLEQEAAEGHTAALTARKRLYRLIVGRALEGVHGALQTRVDVPCVGGVESVLKLALPLNQGVHLVGILQHVGVGEGGIHLVELAQEVHHRLYALAYHLDYRLRGIELGFLLEVAHGIAGREYHLALIILVDAAYYLQQRGFAGAVQADDADLGPVEK